MVHIVWENWPRLFVPLFIAGSIHFALTSSFEELGSGISIIISLFITVQLQKYEFI
jgi:hypothetical protein